MLELERDQNKCCECKWHGSKVLCLETTGERCELTLLERKIPTPVSREQSPLAIGFRKGRHVQTTVEGRLRKINITYRNHL